MKRFFSLGLAVVFALGVFCVGIAPDTASAQEEITPLRVQEAVIGELTAAASTVVYSFEAHESTRMAVILDVIAGDMEPSLVILDQDQSSVLTGATGPATNGVIVAFPTTGTYYVGVTAEEGTAATYRLMVEVAPPLPINVFVSQAFLVSGESAVCEENTPVSRFSPKEDLNVCFTLELIATPVTLSVEWWSPSGEIVAEEGGEMDESFNGYTLLTGIAYPGEPLEEGWWQVHFLLDGELAYVQWVPVMTPSLTG